MGQQPQNDPGKKIEDIVRSALQSGDLSRLKDIGPAVGDAVKSASSTWGGQQKPPPHNNQPPPQEPPLQYNGWQVEKNQPPVSSQPPATPAWYGKGANVRPKNYTGLASIILSAIGLGIFVPFLFLTGILAAIGAGSGAAVASAVLLLPVVGFGGLLAKGLSARKLKGRVLQYFELLQVKDTYSFDEMAKLTGRAPEKIKKDIAKAIDKGMMSDVWLDLQGTCVIKGREAYDLYLEAENSRHQREKEEAERQLRLSDPMLAGIEHFKQEGIETLRKIRIANDRIPDDEVSRKLYQLEDTTGKIFAYVEKHPAKLPETRRFMNYYLPTALKLVEKYCQYDEMDVQVASVVQAKKDISDSLDTIDVAFNNLLDSLYQDDVLDVATDIQVLETMLVQEGLSGKKDFMEAEVDLETEISQPKPPTLIL